MQLGVAGADWSWPLALGCLKHVENELLDRSWSATNYESFPNIYIMLLWLSLRSELGLFAPR